MNPSPIPIRKLPEPAHVGQSRGGEAARVDLACADGDDADHAAVLLASELLLYGVQVESPGLLRVDGELFHRCPAQTHDARGLAERAVAHARQDLDVLDAGLHTGSQDAELAYRGCWLG